MEGCGEFSGEVRVADLACAWLRGLQQECRARCDEEDALPENFREDLEVVESCEVGVVEVFGVGLCWCWRLCCLLCLTRGVRRDRGDLVVVPLCVEQHCAGVGRGFDVRHCSMGRMEIGD